MTNVKDFLVEAFMDSSEQIMSKRIDGNVHKVEVNLVNAFGDLYGIYITSLSHPSVSGVKTVDNRVDAINIYNNITTQKNLMHFLRHNSSSVETEDWQIIVDDESNIGYDATSNDEEDGYESAYDSKDEGVDVEDTYADVPLDDISSLDAVSVDIDELDDAGAESALADEV